MQAWKIKVKNNMMIMMKLMGIQNKNYSIPKTFSIFAKECIVKKIAVL